jgi:hypothetical protein
MMANTRTNTQVAVVLERIADLLEAQDSNPFRVRAYREGAETIRQLDKSVVSLVEKDGLDALTDLPNIGQGIAAVVGEYLSSGKSSVLQDLEAKVSPEKIIANIPGIGKKLAGRIVEQLHVESLEELEEVAHDGRLGEVEGFGAGRIEGVRTALAGMLSRSARSQQKSRTTNGKKQARKADDRPSVALLLDIDEEYRKRADAGDLHKIAPRRFNPGGEAWLPIMNVKRDGWDFTALYSNTQQAHQLGKTDDWVVIYYERDGKERQHTVVTETKGTLKGKRVVRGRELENREYYGAKKSRKRVRSMA